MKKNRELKYDEPKKKKLTKFNYIVIIVPIILVLILVAGIAFYVFIYNSDSNKMKRYLINDGYVCNDVTCTREKENKIFTIDYVNNIFTVDSANIQVRVGEDNPIVDVKDKEMICTYVKDNYNWNFVDDSFIYDKQCESYIPQINEYLTYYMGIRQAVFRD